MHSLAFIPSTDSIHRYHDSNLRGRKGQGNAIEFHYRCAQDKQMQESSRKITDPSKRRDRRSMTFFNCESHLNITLKVMGDTLTAKIDLKHTDDHVPYHATAVAPKAIDYISQNKSKSMKEVRILKERNAQYLHHQL